MKTQSFTLHTERQGCYDITAAVRKCIRDAGLQSGICTVFCPHTTAGILIRENTTARHAEQKTEIGSVCHSARASETLIVENGEPLFGTWQSLYFVECDGPSTRTYFVKVMADMELCGRV